MNILVSRRVRVVVWLPGLQAGHFVQVVELGSGKNEGDCGSSGGCCQMQHDREYGAQGGYGGVCEPFSGQTCTSSLRS